jgi:hypothetical protein
VTVSRSVGWSVGRLASVQVGPGRSVGRPDGRLDSQPVARPGGGQSVSPFVARPVGWLGGSIGQAVSRSFGWSVGGSVGWLVGRSRAGDMIGYDMKTLCEDMIRVGLCVVMVREAQQQNTTCNTPCYTASFVLSLCYGALCYRWCNSVCYTWANSYVRISKPRSRTLDARFHPLQHVLFSCLPISVVDQLKFQLFTMHSLYTSTQKAHPTHMFEAK